MRWERLAYLILAAVLVAVVVYSLLRRDPNPGPVKP